MDYDTRVIDILLSDGRHRSLVAECRGAFGYHVSVSGLHFAVTHIPTGRGVIDGITGTQARRVIELLLAVPDMDWTRSDAAYFRQMRALAAPVKAQIRESLGLTVETTPGGIWK